MAKEKVIRKVLDTVLWTRIASNDNKNILTKALIEALEQKLKKSRWIKTGDYLTTAYGSIDYVECPYCHEYSLEEGNFCPHCGEPIENE